MSVISVTSLNYAPLAASFRAEDFRLDEVLASGRDALPVPRFRGKTIHSSYDPREEAKRFVDAFCQGAGLGEGDTIAVAGNGYGYVAEALLDRGLRPAVFEPSKALFLGMVRDREMGTFLRSVPYFLLDDPSDLYRSGDHRALLASAKAILTLPYVKWLFPAFADGVGKKASAVRAAHDAFYRVSVVSPLVGGSWEIARYAARGLAENGQMVDFVDLSGFGSAFSAIRDFHRGTIPAIGSAGMKGYEEWASGQILERVNAFDPGVVVVLAQAPISPAHIREMREAGRRVLFWFVEDYRLFRYWEQVAGEYDLFLPIQKGEFPSELALFGQSRSHYLPLAADDTIFFPSPPSPEEEKRFGADISFMGAGYYNRRRFFNTLLGRDFKIWGAQWSRDEPLSRHLQEDARRVTSEETARIFNATRVNVNLHSSTSHEGVNPFGDFVNPRTFEIAACGAFQLVDHRALLPDLFEVGEEIVCFGGRDDFLDRMDYFLAHPREREELSRNGRARVLREHTYRDRMRELFDALHEICPPEGERRLPTVGEMATGLADAGWKELLAKFPQERPLAFDALLVSVSDKPRDVPLTRQETITLLLGGLRFGGA
jgi:spore maturation protein CgeB